MQILDISIDRYKSLYEVQFQPGGLSVLAGPNNAGKSNVADALDFLSEIYRFDLNLALQRRGGFENVAYRRIRRTKQAVGFQVSVVMDRASIRRIRRIMPRSTPLAQEYRITHRFSFKAQTQRLETSFEIVDEALVIHERRNGHEKQLVLVRRHGTDIAIEAAERDTSRRDRPSVFDSIIYPFNDATFKTFLTETTRPDRLLVESYKISPLLQMFVAELAQMRVYQLTPLEARKSGTPTPGAGLEKHGTNLPTMVSDLRRRSTETWDSVLEAMRRVMPGLVDIEVIYTPDRRMTLQFHEAAIGRPWSVDEVSDGTIQSLSLFVAIVEAPGPLLLIEEPENSLHPWIVRVVLDLCRSVKGKQIVLTTHSPILLNYVDPPDVWLVWRHEHQTKLARLTDIDPKTDTAWREGNAIFDLLDTGLIPEAIPSGAEYLNIPEVVGEEEDL